MSLSRPRGDTARARFQATVAALGEPARSTFEPAEAEALLARTGWPLAAGASDGQPTAAGHDRLRAAGLLLASVGPPAPAPPQLSQPPQPSQRPQSSQPPHRPKGITAPCPYRPCCPRRWSRSRSSSTTRPNTASRTAPPATVLPAPAPATAPRRRGWCRWPCGRTACGTSRTSPSPSATSKPAPAPGPTWTACAAGVTSPSTAPPGRLTTAARGGTPCCARQRPACGRARSGGRCPDSSSSAGANASARISSAACEIPSPAWSAGWIGAARLPADPRRGPA